MVKSEWNDTVNMQSLLTERNLDHLICELYTNEWEREGESVWEAKKLVGYDGEEARKTDP